MPNLETLSANKLALEIDKRDKRHSAALRAVIDAGYGNHTGNQLSALYEAGKADSVVIENVTASRAYMEAINEQDRRRRYHGSDKPIKKNPIF
jgi:hypothetical protein